MRFRILILGLFCFSLSALFLFTSCKGQEKLSSEEREVVLNGFTKDSVIVFYNTTGDTMDIFRKIEIIENRNFDTLVLGHSVILPRYTGSLFFIEQGMDASKAAYIDKAAGSDTSLKTSYSKLFSVALLNKKNLSPLQYLKIKVRLKEPNG